MSFHVTQIYNLLCRKTVENKMLVSHFSHDLNFSDINFNAYFNELIAEIKKTNAIDIKYAYFNVAYLSPSMVHLFLSSFVTLFVRFKGLLLKERFEKKF